MQKPIRTFAPTAIGPIAATMAMLALAFVVEPCGAQGAGSTPTPVEVRFAPGTSSAMLSGSIAPGHAVAYSLSAVAGQTMSIEVNEGPHCCLLPIDVHVPGGNLTDVENSAKQSWTGTIRTTGPFEVVMRDGNPSDRADYSMSIAIFDPSSRPGIERFDFDNATVVVDRRTLHLKNGRIERSPEIDRDFSAGIDRLPAFGFVDGYPDELALIWVGSSDGGTGVDADLDLYAMHRGKRILVADLRSGDRAEGGFRSARFEDRRLVVEVYAPQTQSGPMCCPAFVDTVRYRFAGGKLVRDGIATRRKAHADEDY